MLPAWAPALKRMHRFQIAADGHRGTRRECCHDTVFGLIDSSGECGGVRNQPQPGRDVVLPATAGVRM